jgi:hypothetical protein
MAAESAFAFGSQSGESDETPPDLGIRVRNPSLPERPIPQSLCVLNGAPARRFRCEARRLKRMLEFIARCFYRPGIWISDKNDEQSVGLLNFDNEFFGDISGSISRKGFRSAIVLLFR